MTALAVGRVARAHGVRGEVAVEPLTEVAARFEPGSILFCDDALARPLTVEASRPHGGRVLVAFRGIGDRDAADALRGAYLFVDDTSSPPLGDGAFWPHHLVGCEVTSEDGTPLGVLTEVLHNPANDVWVVTGDGGEILIPALSEVVRSVDVEGRRIVVRDDTGEGAPGPERG